MLKNYSLNRLLVLLTTIGFLFLMIDSTIEHWSIFSGHLPALIPMVFSAFGLIIGTIAVRQWKETWIRRLHVFLFVSVFVAGAGVYFHNGDEEDEKQITAVEREHEQKEKDKPLLAPLSFAGLAAVGLLGTSRKWQADVI